MVAVAQPAEAVVDRQHAVAAVEAEPHGGPHGGVHARGGAAAVHDGEPEPLAPGGRGRGRGLLHRPQDAVGLAEAAAAQQHRPLEVLRLDPVGDGAGLRDAVHQRRADDLVAAQADQLRGSSPGLGQQPLDCGVAEQRAQVAVERAGRTAALDVARGS